MQAGKQNLLVHVNMFGFTPDQANCFLTVKLIAGGTDVAFVNIFEEAVHTKRTTVFTAYLPNRSAGPLTLQLMSKSSAGGCKHVRNMKILIFVAGFEKH